MTEPKATDEDRENGMTTKLSDLVPYMLEMPDGSVVVGTAEMIEELKALPEGEREKRLAQMEANRDDR